MKATPKMKNKSKKKKKRESKSKVKVTHKKIQSFLFFSSTNITNSDIL